MKEGKREEGSLRIGMMEGRGDNKGELGLREGHVEQSEFFNQFSVLLQSHAIEKTW